MKGLKRSFDLVIAALLVVLGLEMTLSSTHAQEPRNTVTFDNRSGEPALVKLVGPTAQTVKVPHGQSRTVNAVAGEYLLLVRYGSEPSRYTYSRGDSFTVEETAMQYSAITITLHKVVGGNYATYPTSRKEFDEATSARKSMQK